ncbi:MAG: aminotransferase class IV [Planctomycetota bacterium]
MSDLQVHLNGRLVPADQASVSVFDTGFLHGGTTFTTMLAHNGVVFRLDRHLDRLMATVELLGIRTAATRATLTEAVAEVLAANELAEARMRITLSPGSTKGGEPTVLVTAEPLPEYPSAWYEKGITVVVSSFKQNVGDPTYGAKTGCYFPRVLARQEAQQKGAEEALWFTPDNRLAEACFCNAFVVLEGAVRTPPRDTPVLPGVVRQAVMALCEQLEIECSDADALTVREMLAAEEMFLTSSTMGIRPVVRIEAHAVGDETPGVMTQRLMKAYRELLETECPPGRDADG